DEDDTDGDRQHDLQTLFRAHFIFKLPAPTVVVAGWHLDLGADGLFRVGDDAARVASACVEEHGNFEQTVLAVDHGWSGNLPDIRHLPKRDLRSVGGGHEDIRNFVRIAAEFRRVSHMVAAFGKLFY